MDIINVHQRAEKDQSPLEYISADLLAEYRRIAQAYFALMQAQEAPPPKE